MTYSVYRVTSLGVKVGEAFVPALEWVTSYQNPKEVVQHLKDLHKGEDEVPSGQYVVLLD